MGGFVSKERLALGPWQALERALARLIEHAGFKDVTVVGGSGDRGADVIGTMKGQLWLIQSKYRSGGAVVSEKALEEAVSAANAYGADICVAATNTSFNKESFRYQESLRANSVDARLWSGNTLLDYYHKLPDTSRAKHTLRGYQFEAVEAVGAVRSSAAEAALIIMATGLGKSVVAGEVMNRELSRDASAEILVLAHTVDLVKQLERSMWPMIDKSIPTHLWVDGELPTYTGGIIFATWQSIHAAAEGLAGRFRMVVVDEAHHASSPSYSSLISALQPDFLVGMTATPWRGDGKDITGIFNQPVFKMDIVDGMQQGYLAEVDYHMMVDNIDWDEIEAMSRAGHTIKDLNRKLVLPDRDEAIVDQIVDRIEQSKAARVVCFCKTIEHGERILRLFLARNIKAGILHNEVPREERFKALRDFRGGLLNLILSVDMLNEGIDVPDVNMVVFMRVTHSRRIFVQQLGRGLRITKSKTRVLVLDFVADIRRIAAAIELNQEARRRSVDSETIRLGDDVVKFNTHTAAEFFNEYVADVASVEGLDETARLAFPDP